MGRYQNEKQEKEGILSKQGWGVSQISLQCFYCFFLQVRLLQNEKSDKKTGKLGENSHIVGRGGGVDGVSPYGKNSHIFPFFILISFVKSFKVFQFVASGLF